MLFIFFSKTKKCTSLTAFPHLNASWSDLPLSLFQANFWICEDRVRFPTFCVHSDIPPGNLSGILSRILSNTLYGILSDILSNILSAICSNILSDIYSDILFGILSGVDRGWGPAGNTGRWSRWRSGKSLWRSGREHCAYDHVEVRQWTLDVDGRGSGPAANTERGWSWLRSGGEHYSRGWSWRRPGEGGGGGRGGGRGGQATNIKSNNPHLAGGEKR